MWNLSGPGIYVPCIDKWILNHWTIKEVQAHISCKSYSRLLWKNYQGRWTWSRRLIKLCHSKCDPQSSKLASPGSWLELQTIRTLSRTAEPDSFCIVGNFPGDSWLCCNLRGTTSGGIHDLDSHLENSCRVLPKWVLCPSHHAEHFYTLLL